MKSRLVFVDVESDGLYGSILTVALIATDWYGNEIERAYYGISKENMHVTQPWVMENVLPRLGEYEACESEEELLKKAWGFWMRYQTEAYAVCDVGYPVEMQFFQACVQRIEGADPMQAPFPLIDISSVLLAKGYDPLTERKNLVTGYNDSMEHNAMYDIEVTLAVWKKLMIGE